MLAPAGLGVATLLRIRGRVPFTLAFLLACAAIVVAESIALSPIDLLTRGGLLVSQLLVLVAVIVVWQRAGRPRPPALRLPGEALHVAALRRQPALVVLIAIALLAVAVQLGTAILIAPNEADTIGYHLPRVVYWLHHHSAIWPSHDLNDPEISYPPNAELLAAWSVVLSGSDRLTQLVQWLALLGVAGVIFAVARLLGFRARDALWAALLFALMPEPLLQAATVQNDLVVTLFLMSTGFFLVRGLRDRHAGDLVVGALAAGLALGTKFNFAFALPGLLLAVGAAIRVYRPPPRLLERGVAMLVVACVGLGSFIYIQNLSNTGTPTGLTADAASGFGFTKTDPLTDAGRVSWNLVDAEGLPVPGALQRLANRNVGPLFAGLSDAPDPLIRDQADEDGSAYGLVGLLVLFPLTLWTLLRPRAGAPMRILAAGSLGYCVAYTLVLGYSSEASRYLMPAAAGAAVLLASTAARWRVAWPVLALTLATVPGALLRNPDKPIVPDGADTTIFGRDRIDQQTIDPSLAPVARPIHRLLALVPPREPLGYVNQPDQFPEYLLYDGKLNRRLIAFDPGDLTLRSMHQAGVRGVFIAFADGPDCRAAGCVHPPAVLRSLELGPRSYFVLAASAKQGSR
jgi:hypothetical protein